jgi:adenine-specific DNA-methyltransferase
MRRALGIYYTPPEAATLLACWAIRGSEETVLEPSFGGCALLSAATEVFRSLGNREPSSRFLGYDVDPSAFGHLSRLGLRQERGRFHLADFLASEPAEAVDAVLANPPFVSYHRMTKPQREQVVAWRKKYSPSLNQRASLWAYFLLHSMHFLREGGRMAFVLPNAIESADYASAIIEHIRRHFAAAQVLNLSEQLFIQEGAEERVSILLLENFRCQPRIDKGEFTTFRVKEIADVRLDENGAVLAPQASSGRDLAITALMELTSAARALGTAANVEIGEVVGNTRFFARDREDWFAAGIKSRYLSPLLTRSAQVRGLSAEPEVAADALPLLLMPPAGYRQAELSKYLATMTKKRIAANSTFAKRTHWYRCSYDVGADAFIASLAHQFPRVIGNAARISCANSLYKIKVKDEPTLAPWLAIISLTTLFRLSAEVYGRTRGSGAIKLEPSDVRRLLIPSRLPELDVAAFHALWKSIDACVRSQRFTEAFKLADESIYLAPGLISRSELEHLSRLCDELKVERIGRSPG